MNIRFCRPLMAAVVPLALAACVNPEPAAAKQDAAPPLAIDLGGSGPVGSAPRSPAPTQAAVVGKMNSAPGGGMQLAHDGRNDVHATGTVNSVDPAQHKLNVTHQPIPEIGWPTMTMDFAVAPAVDLRAITSGARVKFTIERGQGGMYEIKSIAPAGGGK